MQDTDDFYNENALQFSSETLNLDMNALYLPFVSLLPQGAHVLDAGCGSGRDSKKFMDLGFAVTAFDSSNELCKLAAKNTKLNVLNMRFDEINFSKKFDGIWACASLLHVKKSCLSEIFAKLERALKDSGVLYCSFKYGEFEGERNGRYFTDLTLPALALLIEASQLAVKSHWITSDIRPNRETELWLNAILGSKRELSANNSSVSEL